MFKMIVLGSGEISTALSSAYLGMLCMVSVRKFNDCEQRKYELRMSNTVFQIATHSVAFAAGRDAGKYSSKYWHSRIEEWDVENNHVQRKSLSAFKARFATRGYEHRHLWFNILNNNATCKMYADRQKRQMDCCAERNRRPSTIDILALLDTTWTHRTALAAAVTNRWTW